MMYRLKPVTGAETPPGAKPRSHASLQLEEIKQAETSLQRWEGEGGSAEDAFRVVDALERRKQAIERAVEQNRRTRADWPGWLSGPNESLVPPPRVRQNYVAFTDRTDPAVRAYGYYLITVPEWDYSQLLRASHATAARVARSRTQYGEAELHFLGAIDTPALD
jgi:hypothetical protein